MAKKRTSVTLQNIVGRVAKLHFLYVFVFVCSIVIYDSWQLITPDAVLSRWTLAAVMMLVTTAIWYADWTFNFKPIYDKAFIAAFVILDILVASFLVYAERGMASRGVALYAIPIVLAGLIRSANALLATAILCTVAYSFTAVRYFVVNFNEGYKIELYSTIAFYSVMFFILAGVTMLLIRTKD